MVYSLAPHSKTSYAWDFPSAKDKRIQLSIGNSRRTVDIMEIGALVPFKFSVSLDLFDLHTGLR